MKEDSLKGGETVKVGFLEKQSLQVGSSPRTVSQGKSGFSELLASMVSDLNQYGENRSVHDTRKEVGPKNTEIKEESFLSHNKAKTPYLQTIKDGGIDPLSQELEKINQGINKKEKQQLLEQLPEWARLLYDQLVHFWPVTGNGVSGEEQQDFPATSITVTGEATGLPPNHEQRLLATQMQEESLAMADANNSQSLTPGQGEKGSLGLNNGMPSRNNFLPVQTKNYLADIPGEYALKDLLNEIGAGKIHILDKQFLDGNSDEGIKGGVEQRQLITAAGNESQFADANHIGSPINSKHEYSLSQITSDIGKIREWLHSMLLRAEDYSSPYFEKGILTLIKNFQQQSSDADKRFVLLKEIFMRLLSETGETEAEGNPNFRINSLVKNQVFPENFAQESSTIFRHQSGDGASPFSIFSFLNRGEISEPFSVNNGSLEKSFHVRDTLQTEGADLSKIQGEEFSLAKKQPFHHLFHPSWVNGTNPVEEGEGPITFNRFIHQLQAILQRANFSKNGLTQRLTVRLYPEKLGTLKIQLVKQQGELIARIISSSKQTKELLETHIATLRNAFIQQNIQVQRIAIENMWQFDENFLPREGKSEDERHNRDERREKSKKEDHNQVQTDFERFLVNYEV